MVDLSDFDGVVRALTDEEVHDLLRKTMAASTTQEKFIMSLLVTLQKKMEDTEPKPMELRQALPKLNPEGGKPVYEWLIGMIRQREQLGIKRYGQALRTHNGRIAWLDFIHEAVDGLAYLSQHIMETEEYERRGMLNGVRWALKTSQESESPSKAWEAMEWAIERLSSGQNLPD